MEYTELIILICQAIISLGGIASTLIIVFRFFKTLFNSDKKTKQDVESLKATLKVLEDQQLKANEDINKFAITMTKYVNSIDVSESAEYEKNE